MRGRCSLSVLCRSLRVRRSFSDVVVHGCFGGGDTDPTPLGRGSPATDLTLPSGQAPVAQWIEQRFSKSWRELVARRAWPEMG